MKLHTMIEIYLKYDNMHTNVIINDFICINNRVNSCTICMLLVITIISLQENVLSFYSEVEYQRGRLR